MYLPPGQTDAQRTDITRRFRQYCELLQPLMDEYSAHVHWAKIELPALPKYSVDTSTLSSTSAAAAAISTAGTTRMVKIISTGGNTSGTPTSTLTPTPSSTSTSSPSPPTPEDCDDVAKYEERLDWMRERLAKKYPVPLFNAFRNALDPHNILSNRLIDELFSETRDSNTNSSDKDRDE
jgi:hypothetical protein